MQKIVFEGKIKLKVDVNDVVSKDLEVFYNPEMDINRSISVNLLKIIDNKNMRICLPLAGTGVRAIRMIKEMPEDLIDKIYVNDINIKMKSYLKENLKLNDLNDNKLIVSTQDAKKLFVEDYGYDYIDIDPFGSCNFLLDGAINRISDQGILAVSVTDTACLAGTYPNTCIRKYWAVPRLCPQKHEIGLRILARKVQLVGLQHNKALIPILSYHYKHYYRIFFKVNRSKKMCNDLFKKMNEFYYDNKTGDFKIGFGIGPMYIGQIQDKNIISKLILISEDKEKKILEKLLIESNLDLVGYFDIHDVCEKNKLKVVKTDDVISKLILKGFQAVKVHTSNYGVRTNADINEFIEIIKELNFNKTF